MTRELTPLEKQVKEYKEDILNEIVSENKHVIRRLQATVVLLVCLLFGSFVFYVWSFLGFMSQYDYKNTITTTTTTDNNSKVNNSQNTNAQNNIKIDLPKLGKER